MTPPAAGSPPAAVIFDNDGTFLATEGAWSTAETALFRRYETPFLPEYKQELLGSSFAAAAEMLERFLGRPGRGGELMGELTELVHDALDEGVPVMPGAGELLDALRAAGVPVGMATNAARDFAEKALDAAGRGGAFDALLTADDVPAAKPAPDVFLAAARALGVDPAGCVAVEDSPTGVVAGRAAGMTVVGVPSHPGVDLGDAHHVHASLADPVLWALLGVGTPSAVPDGGPS